MNIVKPGAVIAMVLAAAGCGAANIEAVAGNTYWILDGKEYTLRVAIFEGEPTSWVVRDLEAARTVEKSEGVMGPFARRLLEEGERTKADRYQTMLFETEFDHGGGGGAGH